MLSAGDTFLLPHFVGGLDHLWIVLFNPDPSGKILAVNVTTKKGDLGEDLTVVLNAGDHPFIKHESFIFYAGARISDMALVEWSFETMHAEKQKMLGERSDPCSPELLEKVRKGLLTSAFTPGKIQQYFIERQRT